MKPVHFARNLIAWAVGHLPRLQPVSTAELRHRLENRRIRKILIIRPQQNIGDLILATPVFRALKETYPGCSLHFLGSAYNKAAVQNNPRLDKVWVWGRRGLRNLQQDWDVMKNLRQEKFDLVLVLSSNAPSLTSYLIARLTGAAYVGSTATGHFYGGTNWSRWLSNWETPAAKPEEPEYRKFFALVAPLVNGPVPAPEYIVTESVRRWAKDQWTRLGLEPDSSPVAFFLGGNPSRPDRLWLPEAWAHLARMLMTRKIGPLAAVCPPKGLRGGGGVREDGFYKGFRKALGVDMPVFDEPGLPQAAAFLKPMGLFICPDGGLFHIAAASGVRTLGLFFGSNPAHWRPPIDSVTSIQAPQGRPDRLTPEAVLEAVLQFRRSSPQYSHTH